MKHDKSVSFSGKAGDVTSIDEVSKDVSDAIGLPPAEAILLEKTVPSHLSPWREFYSLFKKAPNAHLNRRMSILAGTIIALLVFSMIGEIRMNKWQGAFFRAIENKNLPEVGNQVFLFVGIMLILLTLVVLQNWLLERLKIRLRDWLSNSLLNEWMKHGHAYRLNMTSQERLNPDQRIQEDVKNLSDLTGDLGIGAARSTFMLVSFIGLLWVMSSGISFTVFERTISIPGYMVWFALLYSSLGSWLAAIVGGPLIRLNEIRYTQEANFRYSLVRVSDNAESISFYHGEDDERRIVDKNFDRVLQNMKRLALANAKLTWIACGHGWLVVILPVVVALPGYLQGKLDFGGLMMVVGAFNQVQQSLRWFVENFGRIADWRTALHRVVVFRDAILSVDEFEDSPEKIHLEPHPNGNLEFDKITISLADGKMVISDATAVILPGERVLLTGESGSGKSTLLRAVGGLWPWGSGRILVPPKEQMMFLPQRPYIPLGSLNAAISYPNSSTGFALDDIKKALERVNLESFIPMLDKTERWDKLMSLGQQQRLAFARLLLHKPRWIFLDESTSALDDDNQERMMSILTEELKDSALVSIAHRKGLERFHTRTLELVRTVHGQVLRKKPGLEEQYLKKFSFLNKIRGPVF